MRSFLPQMYTCIVLLITYIHLTSCNNYKYLGQKPPKDIPQVFAPDFISLDGRNEEVITFSPDGKEIYYSIEFYPDPTPSFTLFTVYENGQWTIPDTVSYSKGRRTSEPFMTHNGNRIYYFANNIEEQKGALDICYSQRLTHGWSEPISLDTPPNALYPHFTLHPCIVSDTSIYFSAHDGAISKSRYRNGRYLEVEVLDPPINTLNSAESECWGDAYVTPDEKIIIFRSDRPGGFGGSDLYIAYKLKNHEWSEPINLGPHINTASDELSGDLTPDGKYLTFSRNGDIYWVSSHFIKYLKEKVK